jgi:hypothetical protein
MIIPVLFAISLSLLPIEERVQIKLLPNGVKTYVQEHSYPSGQGSFRVVLKNHAEEELYRYDGVVESIEPFFDYCKEKGLSASDLPAAGHCLPQEIAVVAVGDFAAGQMQSIIEKHFAKLNSPLPSDTPSIRVGIDPAKANVAVSLSYGAGNSHRDLKGVWKSLLLKDLFQHRLELCSRSLDQMWVHPSPRFFYPISGYSLVPEELSENMLSYFLFQTETMRRDGFYEEEFQRVKQRALGRLQYLASRASFPENSFLASYFADQFLLGDSCPAANAFMDASVEIVSGIHWQEVLADLESFFFEKNRSIQVAYPIQYAKMLTKGDIEQMAHHAVVLASIPMDDEDDEEELLFSRDEDRGAPILLIENMPPGTEPFYQLSITDKEKRLIKIIVNTMAEKNILQLAFIKRTMEKKGKKIEHVHPMRFIGYILSNSELRSSLRTIKKSSFKWDAFIDGFSRRMKEELGNNNLYVHIPGFCHQVGADPDQVTHFIQKKDWEGLVKSCM